jgi:hypothetical protein
MFAVFPFEVVKKISFKKLTDVGGCMGRRLPPSVGNDGWSYRRGPRHGLWWSKTDKFRNGCIFLQNE